MNVERWIWPIQLKNYWKCLHCKTIKEGWFVEMQFGELCPLWWAWGERSKIRFTVSEVTVVKNVIIWLKLSQACTGIQKIPLQLIIDSGHKHISQESWKKKKKTATAAALTLYISCENKKQTNKYKFQAVTKNSIEDENTVN